MSKERPPVLSVLLENERKAQFQQIVQKEGRSMGWVIKDMINRMIAADSIHIYGDSQPPVTSDYPDKVSTEYISMAVLTEYVGKLSILSTDQVTEIARDEAHKLTQPIFDEVLELRGQLSPKKLATDGRIEFATFTQTHGLDIKRGVSAGDIRSALEKAELSNQYRYDSTVRAFYQVDNYGQ